MTRHNENINTLNELNNLEIGQTIEAKGRFPRRIEIGSSLRTLHLTVLSIDQYSQSCVFIDGEGEKWTSLDIYNRVNGDSSSWIKFIK
ncbi:hypothetical protein SAMN02799630_00220 [Paenibacillus sp. UNCCL117]|nr:hypothetical protein SAMN04488602_102311 [Paenibacillus sp. cl123]SFW12036.1 hypothetical protein SAMN02799630_00220 [Paenibacillus sp. UNCCL117]